MWKGDENWSTLKVGVPPRGGGAYLGAARDPGGTKKASAQRSLGSRSI